MLIACIWEMDEPNLKSPCILKPRNRMNLHKITWVTLGYSPGCESRRWYELVPYGLMLPRPIRYNLSQPRVPYVKRLDFFHQIDRCRWELGQWETYSRNTGLRHPDSDSSSVPSRGLGSTHGHRDGWYELFCCCSDISIFRSCLWGKCSMNEFDTIRNTRKCWNSKQRAKFLLGLFLPSNFVPLPPLLPSESLFDIPYIGQNFGGWNFSADNFFRHQIEISAALSAINVLRFILFMFNTSLVLLDPRSGAL